MHFCDKVPCWAPHAPPCFGFYQTLHGKIFGWNFVLRCSRSIGYRFGKHLPATIPLVIKFSHDAVEGDDELREHCLQALEAFVQHSPHEARPNVHHIFDTALQFLNYDPNYADNMDEDDEEDEDMEEDDE